MSSKLEYLKRYQEKSSNKKRKKQSKTSTNFTILDDDANWKSTPADSKLNELGEDPDDAPIVTQVRDDSVIKWKSLPTSHVAQEDEDLSPPRQKRTGHGVGEGNEDMSPPRRKRRGPSVGEEGEDVSPPRRKRTGHSVGKEDEDMSLPRPRRTGPSAGKGSDDLRPLRKREKPSRTRDEDLSPSRKLRIDNPAHQEPPSRTVQKQGEHQHTSKNLKQSQSQLRSKESEDSSVRRSPDDSSVRQSSQNTNSRSRGLGRGRTDILVNNVPAEPISAEVQSNSDDNQFMEWGRGVAQSKRTFEKVVEDEYEMSKPLARYADDEDLEKMLKERRREGDPMLLFMKKSKTGKQKAAVPKGKPSYKGDSAANRFGLRPGYRWDGVDRSNGYEKTWLAQASDKKALQDESYKWSIEDM